MTKVFLEYFRMANNQIIKMAQMPQKREAGLHQLFNVLLMLAFTAMLSACGNETGNTENAQTETNNQKYNGPAPSTTDVQNFKREFWAKLNAVDNCGGCHDVGGTGTTKFVRTDDVNQAYLETLTLADPNVAADSTAIATKVANGHNCWLGTSPTAIQGCADAIRDYTLAWRNIVSSSSQIQLVAPALKDAGASKNFPVGAQGNAPNSFELTVYPLLTANCSSCHSESAATPQSPFFANQSSIDAAATLAAMESAYDAARPKMDLDDASLSRLVIRLREEFHNCWSGDCQADALAMETSIQQFAGNIPLQGVDSNLIISKAMQLGDSMIASSGIRYEDDVIALYEFKEGSGNTAIDTSGVTPSLPLTLNGSVSWVSGFGIEILNGGKAQGSVANSKKLSDFIKASGEYAIEAWVVPGNVVQNNTSIVTYSGGGNTRNFTMGQSQYNYDFLNRNNALGLTTLSTADADEDLQATLQHVVMNFSPVAGSAATDPIVKGRSIYVNGVNTGDTDMPADAGGLVTSWNDTYALAIGNEPGGASNTLWKGKIRLLAIHSRALTQEQITQNLQVGVGQKYFMLFSISTMKDINNNDVPRPGIPADSYILFQVEQYDNTAYLFNKPTFVNLDPNFDATSFAPITIKGMRIAVNSRVAVSGQAFGHMDVVANPANYVDGAGQVLSDQGTVISVEKGFTDEFFLSFEQLSSATNAFVEPSLGTRTFPSDPAQNVMSDIGMRTFDEINATMSAITGITTAVNLDATELAAVVVKEDAYRASGGTGTPLTTTEQLDKTFTFYRQQLPSIEDIQAFLSSHQMGVAQMAVKYCDVLVETNPSFFQDAGTNVFAMNSAPATAFANATERNKVTYPLLQKIMNVDGAKILVDQPDATEVQNLISDAAISDTDFPQLANSLIDEMMAETACFFYEGDTDLQQSISCTGSDRTKQIVKASCAAILGSSVMLVQ
jgi:cytochrome c553